MSAAGSAGPTHPASEPRLEPVFRETILWRFRNPEHIETLRRFGDLLYSMAAETLYWGATHGWSLFHGEAHAAAADLEHVASSSKRSRSWPTTRTWWRGHRLGQGPPAAGGRDPGGGREPGARRRRVGAAQRAWGVTPSSRPHRPITTPLGGRASSLFGSRVYRFHPWNLRMAFRKQQG